METRKTDRPSPGIGTNLLALVGMIIMLEDASRQVAPHPFAVCASLLAMLGAVAAYGYCLGGRTLPRARARGNSKLSWLVLPCAFLLVLSAVVRPWPLHVRFALSREAFERALIEVQNGRPWEGAKWVGLFPVRQVDTWSVPNGVCFIVGSSIADPVAICYDPRRPQSSILHMSLAGPWYASEL